MSLPLAERAVHAQAYLAQHGIREKLETALTELIASETLPENPFAALVETFSRHELMCRARLVFDRMDVDRSGSIDRKELFAKLRADDEVECLLKRQAVGGEGFAAAKAMGRLLVSLDSDAGDGMGVGLGLISWGEFESAVLAAA